MISSILPVPPLRWLEVETLFFLLGGHLGEYHDYIAKDFTPQFLQVDLTTNVWSRLASYPFGVQGLRMVWHNSFLYAFGGFIYDHAFDYSDWQPGEVRWAARSTDLVYRYDISTNVWRLVATMPRRRSSNVLFKSGAKVFLIAGWDGTSRRRGDRAGQLHEVIDIFDLDTEQFEPSKLLLTSPFRRALSGCEFNGRFALFGGIEGRRIIETVTVFDPTSGQFDDNALPKLPNPLFASGSCFTGKWIVVAGGNPSHGEISDKLYKIGVGDSSWQQVKQRLATACNFIELVPLSDNRVLAIGGHGDPYPLAQWQTIDLD